MGIFPCYLSLLEDRFGYVFLVKTSRQCFVYHPWNQQFVHENPHQHPGKYHQNGGFSSQLLHPGRLTRNLRIHPWKRKIIWTKPSFSGSMLIFGGGSLQECIIHNLNKHQFFNPHRNPSLHTNKMVHKVQASYVKLTGVYPINTHYLVVSTPLKNMIVKLGIIFPIFGVKNKKSFKPSPR